MPTYVNTSRLGIRTPATNQKVNDFTTIIQALGNDVDSKVTRRINLRTASGAVTAADGDRIIMTATGTVTAPASAAAGDWFSVVVGFTPGTAVTVAHGGSSSIYGVGLSSASSFLLGVLGARADLMFDGTNWAIIAGKQDTGWIALTLGTNVNTLAGFYTPQARQIGDLVYLRGQMDSGAAISSGATIFTTPFHPASKVILLLSLNATALVAIMSTAGVVTIDGTIGSAGSSFGVDGLVYSLV